MQQDPSPSSAVPADRIPPPPPWQPAAAEEASVLAAHQDAWQRDSLQKELAATRDELDAMRALLDELPGIFESRFAGRMEPLLAQKQRLLLETDQLRQQLLSLQPAGNPGSFPALLPGSPSPREQGGEVPRQAA